MNKVNHILIVDDEDSITETISVYLGNLGHKVSIAKNALEALGILEKKENVDLVLSDINMPNMSGIEFYQAYKMTADCDARFVLMTGQGDLMNVNLAYSLGVDELLAKPFDFDVLKLVIDYLLETTDSFGNQEDNYFAIPVEDLIISSTSQYNLYLKINKKYICVTKTGQEFTSQRLKNFKSKGLKFIYLSSVDYAKYTDLQFTIADSMKLRPVDNAKKSKAFNHLISTVSKNSVINKIDKESLSRALTAFENYSLIAFNNTQMADMLFLLTKNSPDLSEKSSMLAVISSSIADLWRWSSPKTQSRIVLGALLCDIGLKEYPALQIKKRLNYTKEEEKAYEEHPFRSYKMLSDIGDLPFEVLEIALQHHENGMGNGFPQKLLRSKVHPFSKLVHGVSEFIEILYSQKDPGDTKTAIDQIFNLQRKIVSEQVIKSLYLVFNHPVPKELEDLLLPDKLGRMG